PQAGLAAEARAEDVRDEARVERRGGGDAGRRAEQRHRLGRDEQADPGRDPAATDAERREAEGERIAGEGEEPAERREGETERCRRVGAADARRAAAPDAEKDPAARGMGVRADEPPLDDVGAGLVRVTG